VDNCRFRKLFNVTSCVLGSADILIIVVTWGQ